jgi:pyruvate formate lyase activating enzyme
MSGTGLIIAGWNKPSFIDFPGKIAVVLFFAGCNLRCNYCHNPGIVRNEFSPVDISIVKDYLKKRRDEIEGVVLSGGEPTIHAGLPGLVHELRALHRGIKLDTNGLLPDMVSACAPDYLALDIKTIPSRYGELGFTGGDADAKLRRSIETVREMGTKAEIRITVVPKFIDGTVIAHLKNMVDGVAKVFLQHFKNDAPLLDPAFAAIEPYEMEKMQEFRKMLEPVVGECVIR